MPGVRSVSLGVWVLAGSRDEAPAISGSSHFLEHLLFKGTQTRSAQDIAEAFDAVGGDLNAFTAKEYTCYYARVLDRDLELAVDHLADMLQHSRDPLGGPRRRAAGDPRGDQHARGLARGPRARRLHRDALAGPSARPPGPRHGRHDRGGDPRLGATASTSATTCPGTSWWRRRATSGTTTSLSLLADAHGDGPRARPRATTRRGTSGARATRRPRPARAWSAAARPSRRTSAWERTAWLGRIPTGSRSSIVNTALGGGMSSRLFQEIRERRGLAYSRLQLPLAVHGGGAVHGVRGHDAGARRAGDRAAPPRARRRRVRRPHRGGVRARDAAT